MTFGFSGLNKVEEYYKDDFFGKVGSELFRKKKYPKEWLKALAREAFRVGYKSGISDYLAGVVRVKETQSGYEIVEGEGVPAKPTADSGQSDKAVS